MTHMTSAVWTSSNGSQCSKTFMRNSTITILTAKREWSAKSWKNPNTTETWPSNSNLDSSKLPLCIFTSFFSYVFILTSFLNMPRFDEFLSKVCFYDFLNKQRYQLALFQCRLFFHKYAKTCHSFSRVFQVFCFSKALPVDIFTNVTFSFTDTPNTWKFCLSPTIWGNSLMNTLMPTAVLRPKRVARNSSNAPTLSRTLSRGTWAETAFKF